MSRFASTVLTLLLVLAGSLAWTYRLRAPLRVEPASLAAIPYEVDGWRGVDVPLDGPVEAMLRADYNVQRTYRRADGVPIWVYLGYYGTERGGLPEHTPPQCYAAHGWSLLDRGDVPVDPGRKLRVREMIVEQGGHRRLVHFWYRSHGGVAATTPFGLRASQVWSRLTQGRADGSLLRFSTPLAPDEALDDARARLAVLEQKLDAALDALWPQEVRPGERAKRGSA